MKKAKKRGRRKRIFPCGLLMILSFVFAVALQVQAAWENNPYISFSPDGNAYTTNAGETDYEWYETGTVVKTGVEGTVGALNVGQHYYSKSVNGLVLVGKWVVMHETGTCIHNSYTADGSFYGVTYGTKNCGGYYYSGWFPYCVDCNEVIVDRLYYMSKEAAESLTQIDVSKAYYYKCPHCDNLEQAVEQPVHICKGVSYNRYFVGYHANLGSGYMAKSTHMYNDATSYEGKEVTPQTTLHLNTYTREGYRFVGWNTKQDGSGTFYEDGAVIYNLTEEEGETVILYAQWEECHSVLQIDPAGGSYCGNTGITKVQGACGECYEIAPEQLTAAAGYTVHFDSMGGKKVEDIVSTKSFKEWMLSNPFYGELDENTYYYSNMDAVTDTLTAVYKEEAIVLPSCSREGYSFGGWFLDEDCTKPVGSAGSEFTPGKELTLYAGWVDLMLAAEDNYVSNEGKGAVNLSWSQKDAVDKVYIVYQKKQEEDWVQVSTAQEKSTVYEADVTIGYLGQKTEYTIPFSGFYSLTLYGAQGGNYAGYTGGKGGMVQASIYFNKGERLQCIIGGQNGYSGGGVASLYANGGGYSIVSTQTCGTLLIAGGGGGASAKSGGLAGGSAAGVTDGNNGEAGVSGGGGGYLGGRAGVLKVHSHGTDCLHIHEGDVAVYGGCYTVPVKCGCTQFDKVAGGSTFYYGNRDGNGNLCYCVRCASYSCAGHRDTKYYYVCATCEATYEKQPASCTKETSYAPGCKLDGCYVCGMSEGEVLACQAAYGGSNYINPEYCYNYTESAGVRSGNGVLYITAENVGTVNGNRLSGVEAPDEAAPDAINLESVTKTAVSEKEIRISFDRPRDNGTVYYHQVQSFEKNTGQWLCTSNQTVNTLTSQVTGYYYLLNKSAKTQVTVQNSYYEEAGENPSLVVEVSDTVQYLHIAAVDKAGNIGETVHIEISMQDVVFWPLRTEKISVKEGENVAEASTQDTYYVKADGTTPFTVGFEGYLCGSARADYQIEYLSFCMSGDLQQQESVFSVITPKKETVIAGSFTYPMQALQKKIVGEPILQDAGYTVTKRYNQCKNLSITQKFTISQEYDGQCIRLVPRASIENGRDMISSQEALDRENGILLIADGQGPAILGLESLEQIEYIDLTKEDEVTVSLSAQDAGSGLSKFYAEVVNMENGSTKRYEDSQLSGQITFVISGEEIIYNGEFSIIVYAADAVGNETSVSTQLLGIGLSAYVERILEPHDASFKRGESGVLHVQATGYVERIEIYFPEEFAQAGEVYDCVYEYDNPGYIQTLQIEFMIPLTIEEGTKTICVKAYKAGTQLEATPQFVTIVIEGDILDELRTRLR